MFGVAANFAIRGIQDRMGKALRPLARRETEHRISNEVLLHARPEKTVPQKTRAGRGPQLCTQASRIPVGVESSSAKFI